MCKSRIFGGMSACSETVNLVVVFLFLPVVASGEFCSANLVLVLVFILFLSFNSCQQDCA